MICNNQLVTIMEKQTKIKKKTKRKASHRRTFKQQLQFRLIAPQYQRPPQFWATKTN